MVPHLRQEVSVVRGARQDRDGRVVLRRGPGERDPADVDELLPVGGIGVLGQVPFERIEVDDHELERAEAPLGELRPARLGPGREDTSEDTGVQGLHSAPEPGADPGELLGRAGLDSGPGQGRASPAGRPELRPEGGESPAELLEPGFIVHREQGALDVDDRPRFGCHRPYPQAGGWARDKFRGDTASERARAPLDKTKYRDQG